LFLQRYGAVPDLHSFPTRRSSDLELGDDLLDDHDLNMVRDWKPNEGFGEAHRRQLRLIFEALAAGETPPVAGREARKAVDVILRSEEHTSELQSRENLVCRLLLEK